MENKLKDLKPLFSRKINGGQILSTRININHRKLMCVSRAIHDLSVKQTSDRHMSILFDQPRQSGAAFAGERRFSKSRGLSASISFLPHPLPPLYLALVSFLTRPKYAKTGLSLPRNQTETLATQANLYLTIAINYTSVNSSCAHSRPRADPWVLAFFCLGWQIPVGGDS